MAEYDLYSEEIEAMQSAAAAIRSALMSINDMRGLLEQLRETVAGYERVRRYGEFLPFIEAVTKAVEDGG